MEAAFTQYTERSRKFRQYLEQAILNSSTGLSLAEQVKAKDADIMHTVARFISDGRLILKLPSRIRNTHADDPEPESSSNESDDGEEELEGDTDFDPKISEEVFRKALAGQGAVVIGDKSVLVHNYLGKRSTDSIVCSSPQNKALVSANCLSPAGIA